MNARDETKILRILREGYTFAMYVGHQGPALADEFHPDFQVLVPEIDGRTGEIVDVRWVRPTLRGGARPRATGPDIAFDCRVLDISGRVAVGKVEVHQRGRLVCTDYVLLFRVGREWRIVGKTFHQHAGAAATA